MIRFETKKELDALICYLEKDADEVSFSHIEKECNEILKKIHSEKFSKIIFISLGDFWHKKVALRDFHSLHECMTWAKTWRSFLRSIEKLDIPTFSYIHFEVEGLGLELALATKTRIAKKTATFSLQDVRQGYFPVGGTLKRLISLASLKEALNFLLMGNTLSSIEAKKMGIVDFVTEESFDVKNFPFSYKKKITLPFCLKNFFENLLYKNVIKNWRKEIIERFRGHFRSPLKVLELIEEGKNQGSETQAQKEIEAFSELVFSTQCLTLEGIYKKLRTYLLTLNATKNQYEKIYLSSGIRELSSLKSLFIKHGFDVEIIQKEKMIAPKGLIFTQNEGDLGHLFTAKNLQTGKSILFRLFYPYDLRKIVEIYDEGDSFLFLASLFTQMEKIPIAVKTLNDFPLEYSSPVCRLDLALTLEAHFLLKNGFSKDEITYAWKKLGMHPDLFSLWEESVTDHFESFKPVFKKNSPERFDDSLWKVPSSKNFLSEAFVCRIAKESILLLEEKVLSKALFVDLISIYGIGFPRYQGGILSKIETENKEKWPSKFSFLESEFGVRFSIPKMLDSNIKEKRSFYDERIF